MMTTRRPLPALIALALLALLLGLAGCGDDGATPPAAAGARATAADEAPLASSTVTSAQSSVAGRTSTARATAAATPTGAIAAMEREVLRRINAIRQERGLQPLEPNDTLAAIARGYSCQMARQNFFSHTSPSGGTVADRVREAGIEYRLVGENLARNTNADQPVEVAVQGWMNSEGHRENILREAFTETGVGICRERDRYYFTQIFLQPR